MSEFGAMLFGVFVVLVVGLFNYDQIAYKMNKEMISACVYGFDPKLRESTGQADFKVIIVDGEITDFECIEMDRPPLQK